jgi:glycosyltransferase involved in cell wall biosynthesis
MRILMFNYEYPPVGGGGGVVHALVAEELARRHRVCVVTSAYGSLPTREVRDGVEIRRVPVLGREEASVASLISMLSYPPSTWLAALGMLRRERFDVINSHFAVPTGPGSLPVAKLARIPHVLSIHGGDLYDPSKRLSPHRMAVLRWAVRYLLRNSDAVVAQSSDTREKARRIYGYEGPVTIIPHGIRPPRIRPATREELGLPRDVFLAVTVGRLIKRKASDRLLLALARPECSPVHMVVVGEGPELETLQDVAARLGVAGRVLFTGYVEEGRKWQILQCADAYVSASLHEGFGLVYLEAMAAGLPIVTTDHGGHLDFLREGDTGYLVPAGDDATLARAIARLMADPGLRNRISEQNRARSASFTAESCARAYEVLLEEVVRGGSAGRR